MKNAHFTVCLVLAGLLCILPVSGCTSKGEENNSSPPEGSAAVVQSSGEAAVSDDSSPSSLTDESKAGDGSETSEESSRTEESQSSEESIPAENIPVGRFTRSDPMKDSEYRHLNYEMELYPYNGKLYARVLSLDVQYVSEYENVDDYDPNIVEAENFEMIASVSYDTETDTFVFTPEDYEFTVKYNDRHELEVSVNGSLYDDYIAGTYICQTAENKHPAPETVHDPKSPDGRMDAGIAENVRNALSLAPDAEITKEDCKKITRLTLAYGSNPVTSLDGIEYLSGLKKLEVGDSTVKDISALAKLPELESISFTNSMIEVIPDLSACKKLKEVAFVNDFITDISPLAKLQSLESVMLISDQVRSIAPLKDNHTIKSLTLTNTCVTDWESIGDNEDLKKALFCDYKYYLEMQNKAEQIIRENITDDMSALEKQVRLAKYVEDFMEYEHVAEDPDKNVPFGYQGIVENKGVCVHYAYAAKYLMTLAGLEVIVCTSYDHDWNMIKLDGRWYEFDCTWDDEKDIENWSWFNRSSAAVSRNDHHCHAMPERMPYAEKDMPFTEYCRYGTLPD